MRVRMAGEWTSERVRVVIADDSVLIREGTTRLLEDAGLDVVGQAVDGDDLMLKGPQLFARHRDRRHPHAADAYRRGPARGEADPRAYPATGVLVLSQYVETEYATELLSDNAEGIGYLLKDRVADIADFVAAVRRVAAGGSALDPVDRLAARRPSPRLGARRRDAA